MLITLHPQKLYVARVRAQMPRRELAEAAGIQEGTLIVIEDITTPFLIPRQIVDRLIQKLVVRVTDITIVPPVGFPVELVEPCNTSQMPTNGHRAVIVARDGQRCVYCGATDQLDIDHVVPASRGGPTVAGNLVTSCRRCNNFKGDSVPSEARMEIAPQTMLALRAWWQEQAKPKRARRVLRRWWCSRCGASILTTATDNVGLLCELCQSLEEQ